MRSGSISPPLFAVIAVTAFLSSSRQSLVVAQTDCTNVNCPQNTTCVDEPGDFASVLPHGVDSLPFLDTTANWHCEDCPQGFTGLLCDVPIDTCDNGANGGKAKHCYNGGKCVTVGNGTDVKYHCDCSDAVRDEKSYAGLHCEHVQTTTCELTEEEDRSWLFCVNGRDCKEDIDNFLRHPCKCGSEFEGPHCEYKTGTKPACDLECFNGGRCNIGVKNYDAALDAFHLPHTEERHMDFQHCICKDGFTGLQCDVQKIACGEHHCYNGGTCYNTTQHGHYNYHCDCNPANTDEASFAGRFCEHKSTNFCTKKPDQNGHLFCTNEGTCNVDNPHEGCITCPEGFKGPSCEYPDGAEEKCDHLQCANGGKCRKGIKDNGTLKQHANAIAFLNQTNDNFEHCVCPDGYTGLKCEHQVEMCGDDAEHICLHGSKCVSGGDGTYTCNCDPASNETKKFAGHFCEHDSNDVCTKSGKASGDSSQAFCVNGGTCEDEVEDGEHHPGCKCNEGFFGDHCEYQEGLNPLGLPSSSSSGEENSDGNGKGAFVAALVISLFAVFGLVLAVVFTRRRNQREAASSESSSPPGKNLAPLGAIFEEIDLNDEKVKGFNPTAYVNRVSDTPDII